MLKVWIILLYQAPVGDLTEEPRYLGHAWDEDSCTAAAEQLVKNWPVGSEAHCKSLKLDLPKFFPTPKPEERNDDA